MEINQETKGNVTIFTISGRIDSATSPTLEQKILSSLHEKSIVLLDLSKVEYLSSAGIRILVLCHKEIEKKGGQILLSNLPKSIEQVLYLTGFMQYFKIFETKEEALRHIHN